MSIQWFPGHMAKAKRLLQEDLRLVDVLLEVIDARIPESGRNPDLNSMAPGKRRVLVINKGDLADPATTSKWLDSLNLKPYPAVVVDSLHGNETRSLFLAIKNLEGIKRRVPRAMVVGVPNSGKSSLINRLAGRAPAKTGAMPGVTRGRQWVKTNAGIYLLDTPGVLPPKLQGAETGFRLAVTGAIGERAYKQEEVASLFLEWLVRNAPGNLERRYGIGEKGNGEELLLAVGRTKGHLIQAEMVDTKRTSALVLRDFRSGVLGRHTLDPAPERKSTDSPKEPQL